MTGKNNHYRSNTNDLIKSEMGSHRIFGKFWQLGRWSLMGQTRTHVCFAVLWSWIECRTSSSTSLPREDGNGRTNLPLVFDPLLSFFTLMFLFLFLTLFVFLMESRFAHLFITIKVILLYYHSRLKWFQYSSFF